MKGAKAMSYYTTCPKCGASLDPGEKCDCVQTKEKSTETAATVNGANLNNHNQDITNPTKKQPFKVSEYLEYCDCMGKQPDKSIIEFIESNSEAPRYPRETREEIESELTKTAATLAPAYLDSVIEFARFLKWRNKRNNT